MRKRIAAILGALMVSIGIIAATATPAAASWEEEYSKDVDWAGTPAKDCASGRGYDYILGDVCVQPEGDDLWVRDSFRDGYGVAMYWEDLNSDRAGWCVDALGVDKAWTMCNKDFVDGHTILWTIMFDSSDGWIFANQTFSTVV
jgi:hypothetical protein